MKRLIVYLLMSMVLLCSCKEGTKDIQWTKNDIFGIDFAVMLEESLSDIKHSMEEVELRKDDAVYGTYYVDEVVSGNTVLTTLQFAYFDDVNLENWEIEKPEKEHQLSMYVKEWTWSSKEYSDEDYAYVISVFDEICEKYGEPAQIQEGPEGYGVGEDASSGFTVMWNTGEFVKPDISLQYSIDGEKASLKYRQDSEFVVNLFGVS